MSTHRKKHNTISYYSIASTTLSFDKITCKKSPNYLKTILSSSLYYYWTEIMLQCRKITDWEHVHRQFHPYAWLYDVLPSKHHTYTKIGNVYTSVFYEMTEIIAIMNLHFEHLYKSEGIHFGPHSEYIKQAFLHSKTNPHQQICYPAVFQNSFHPIVTNDHFCDLITLSSIANNEYNYTIDLIKQFCIGICVQKQKGGLVFKMKTMFHSLTVDFLYLICSLYDKVYMTKPLCTNPCEFTKYVVCKGLRRPRNQELFLSSFQSLYFHICNCPSNEYVERILTIHMPNYFIHKLEELNSIFGQPCLEHVYNILVNHHNVGKHDHLKQDIAKCQEWCHKHNIPIYDSNTTTLKHIHA